MIPQSAVWERLRQLYESVENQVARDLQREFQLGLTEYRALRLLSTAPNSELRMQELAAQLGLNQSSVTRLVGRLERNGYTVRDVCPDDKRGVYSVITENGRKIQEKAAEHYERFLEAALERSATEVVSRDIVESLRKLSAANG
jgi:DNA-binding MarR family transcriptional regulator